MSKEVKLKKYGVPKTAITEKGLRRLIKAEIDRCQSQAEWAKEKNVQSAGVSAFMRQTQSAGLAIPAALGYRPQVIYLPLDHELIETPRPQRNAAHKPSGKTDVAKPPIEKPAPETKEDVKKRLKDKGGKKSKKDKKKDK